MIAKAIVGGEEERPISAVINLGNDNGPPHSYSEFVLLVERNCFREKVTSVQSVVARILEESSVECIGSGLRNQCDTRPAVPTILGVNTGRNLELLHCLGHRTEIVFSQVIGL